MFDVACLCLRSVGLEPTGITFPIGAFDISAYTIHSIPLRFTEPLPLGWDKYTTPFDTNYFYHKGHKILTSMPKISAHNIQSAVLASRQDFTEGLDLGPDHETFIRLDTELMYLVNHKDRIVEKTNNSQGLLSIRAHMPVLLVF